MDDRPQAQPPSGDELQFDQAEGEGTGPAEEPSCAACHQVIAGEYYEVNAQTICGPCRQKIAASLTGGSRFKRLVKATVFGLAGGALGAGIYFAVLALTGYEVALIAIVVGLLVGGAVRAGSEARGGWFYQALAIAITYCAIVVTYVPMIVEELEKHEVQEPRAAALTNPAPDPAGAALAPGGQKAAGRQGHPRKVTGLLRVIMYVFAFVLAFISPVLQFDLIGYLIKGFALYEAWKINKRPQVTITGPYRLAVEGASASTMDAQL